jgi:hypothetical protein
VQSVNTQSVAAAEEEFEATAAAAASSSSVADIWAASSTPDTEVIHLNSSSFADFVQSTAAVEGAAAAAPTAAASDAVAAQGWGRTWRPRQYRDAGDSRNSVSCVMLKARLSSASSQQMWLAGMSAGCGRFQRDGRQFLTAPMTACWVNGGEQGRVCACQQSVC